MIRKNNYFADILRVCEIKDLIWVMRFQRPLVYVKDLRDIMHVFMHQHLPGTRELFEHKAHRLSAQTSTKGPGKY